MSSSRIGNFFFRVRSFTPIPFILALIYFANPTILTTTIGLFFTLIGELLRIWTVGYAGGSTRATTLGAARDLVTTGPYGHVRNPLYLGNLLISISICIIANVLWLTPILVIGYLVQYLPIITVEEAYLLESCGSVYKTYKEQVPRFFPQFHSYQSPSTHDFSLVRAFNSEKRTLAAIFIVIAALFVRQIF